MKVYDIRLNDDGDLVYSAGTNSEVQIGGTIDLTNVEQDTITLKGTDSIDINSDNYVNLNSGSDVNINSVNDTYIYSQNNIIQTGTNNITLNATNNLNLNGNRINFESDTKTYIESEDDIFIDTYNGNKVSLNANGVGGTIEAYAPNLDLYGGDSGLSINNSSATYYSQDGAGIQYSADYSSTYTSRSLVDKAYTDVNDLRYVRVRTTANLTANYSNGTNSGVGATLTATTNVVLPSQDGVSLSVGDRILVMAQTTTLQNGIYVVTSLGSAGSAPWVLTRAKDADTPLKIYNSFIYVKEGTTFQNTNINNLNTSSAITIGTTAITYFVSGGYSFGNGLTLTNRTITALPLSNTITRAMLSNGSACSVIGRSVNSAGATADITAGSDGYVLKRTSGVLGFSSITASDLPFQILGNSYSNSVTSVSTFTVTIGSTLANTSYKVTVTPASALASANFYIANKSTTTFDVVYASALTGLVAFDWHILN